MTFIKLLYFLLAGLIIIALVRTNYLLYSYPEKSSPKEYREEIIKELNFLETEIKKNNAGEEMQALFPEGFVFINVLYGLSWCEIAKTEEPNSDLYKKALREARFAYTIINSTEAKSTFNVDLKPAYGIFYAGWRNYLLANIFMAQKEREVNESELLEFKTNSKEIALAFTKSKSPFIESYHNSAWPADAIVAMTSLSIYNKLYEASFNTLITNWLSKVKGCVDKETGLIPHSVRAYNCRTIEGARGSSISLSIKLIADIDAAFAVEQFKLYNDQFVTTRLGLPAVREYPLGKDGSGDIDSGPVILDVGFVATLVALGTFKKLGERKCL